MDGERHDSKLTVRGAPDHPRVLRPCLAASALLFRSIMEHSPRFLALVEDTMPNVRECSPTDVQAWLSSGVNFHLVDVREESEVAEGRIKGSKHIGRGVLERDIEVLIPDIHARIVLYCGGGYRSALAANSIQRMGYTDVYSMAGGIRAWRSAMLPEEK